jgi:hypothetical protein
MKKFDQSSNLFKKNFATTSDQIIKNSKTTNVNILLNRVRLNKKKDLQKKIIILFSLLSIISVLLYGVVI